MDVRRDDRGYVRCGGTGVARLVRTRLAADLRPGSSRSRRRQAPKLLIRCANVLLDRASQSTIELDQCDVSEERSILRRWKALSTAARERA